MLKSRYIKKDCIDDIEYKKYYLGIYELCYGDFRYGVKLINSCDVDSEELVYIRKILSGEIVENVYPRYNDQLGNFVELLDKYIIQLMYINIFITANMANAYYIH